MNATTALRNCFNTLRSHLVAALALVAFLGVTAIPAVAQLTGPMTVEVPFAFVAGKKVLPAGTYVFSPSTRSTILVRASNGENASIVTTMASDAKDSLGRSEVLFKRYGDTYYLAEVRPAASSEYRRVARTQDEIRLAKLTSKPDVVTLVANKSR
jgi:hypothetical protein